MKTRILIIALALVFVSTLAVAKPFQGDVPAPFNVSADLCDDVVTVEWEACTYEGCAAKFSVVYYTTYWYEIYDDVDCEDCWPIEGEVEVELDYGTADELEGLVFTELGDGNFKLEIEKAIVDADFDAAFEDAMGDCLDCVEDYGFGDVYVKVKGLNPGKGKGRQNNEFSDAVLIEDCIQLLE
jgi:hypothetical protein